MRNVKLFTSPFLLAPVLVFVYGVFRFVDGLDGSRGPGVAWTVGHLAFIAAMAAFIAVFARMRRMAERGRTASVLCGAGIAGATALIIQFGIDVAAGLQASDNLELSLITGQIRSFPGVTPVAYDIGPYFFYLAQLALIVLLAVTKRVGPVTPFLVCLDLVTPFISKDLIPIGSILLFISFLPLARRRAGAAVPDSGLDVELAREKAPA